MSEDRVLAGSGHLATSMTWREFASNELCEKGLTAQAARDVIAEAEKHRSLRWLRGRWDKACVSAEEMERATVRDALFQIGATWLESASAESFAVVNKPVSWTDLAVFHLAKCGLSQTHAASILGNAREHLAFEPIKSNWSAPVANGPQSMIVSFVPKLDQMTRDADRGPTPGEYLLSELNGRNVLTPEQRECVAIVLERDPAATFLDLAVEILNAMGLNSDRIAQVIDFAREHIEQTGFEYKVASFNAGTIELCFIHTYAAAARLAWKHQREGASLGPLT